MQWNTMESVLNELNWPYDYISGFLPFSKIIKPEGKREEDVMLLPQRPTPAGKGSFIPVLSRGYLNG